MKDIKDFLEPYIKNNRSTKEICAALKFRFNKCENRKFDFSGLAKSS